MVWWFYSHYVAIFACYTKSEDSIPYYPLLVIAPLLNEEDMTAQSYKDFIETTLQIYGKNSNNVLFLTGDNCPTNKVLADLMNNLLIGCTGYVS